MLDGGGDGNNMVAVEGAGGGAAGAIDSGVMAINGHQGS